MTRFIGEYDCRLDVKGRIILPAGLKRQVPEEAHDTFIVNRGFEKCLVLYPKNEWNKITTEINKLNPYKKQNREFIRYFFRGASELVLDSASRLLLPKRLLEYAGIDKELVLFAHTSKVEIWAKEIYENMLGNEPADFSELAEAVMGNNKDDDND